MAATPPSLATIYKSLYLIGHWLPRILIVTTPIDLAVRTMHISILAM